MNDKIATEILKEMKRMTKEMQGISKVIRELKKPNLYTAPYTPGISIPDWPEPATTDPIKPTCAKCGIFLEPSMGYCCPRPDCPTGMGPAIYTTDGTSK